MAHAGKLRGQYPGTVVEIDGELWILASTVREIVRTAKRHRLITEA